MLQRAVCYGGLAPMDEHNFSCYLAESDHAVVLDKQYCLGHVSIVGSLHCNSHYMLPIRMMRKILISNSHQLWPDTWDSAVKKLIPWECGFIILWLCSWRECQTRSQISSVGLKPIGALSNILRILSCSKA